MTFVCILTCSWALANKAQARTNIQGCWSEAFRNQGGFSCPHRGRRLPQRFPPGRASSWLPLILPFAAAKQHNLIPFLPSYFGRSSSLRGLLIFCRVMFRSCMFSSPGGKADENGKTCCVARMALRCRFGKRQMLRAPFKQSPCTRLGVSGWQPHGVIPRCIRRSSTIVFTG